MSIMLARNSDFNSECIVCLPGSARTRWGSSQRSPDPIAGLGRALGVVCKGWERKGEEITGETGNPWERRRKKRREGKKLKKKGKHRRGVKDIPPAAYAPSPIRNSGSTPASRRIISPV